MADITQPLAALPPGLPKRHLFWREEMADGQIGSMIPTERSVADDMTWYEHKFDLMKFLGMRTFAKDLLEFGSNQGWDSTKFGGNDWVYQTPYIQTSDGRIVGYFCCDVDYAGPFVMLSEAMAVANGDPRYIGYLSSHTYNRGNPGYVRRFNANFIALLALPSTRESGFSTDPELVVRKIVTPHNGIYLAAVHTGRIRKTMTLALPRQGRILDGLTGVTLLESGTNLGLTLDPCELRALRYSPANQNTPPRS